MAEGFDGAPEPLWRAGLGDAQFAVVTGANSGIGLAAATALAEQGWAVALVARDAARLAAAKEQVALASAQRARRFGHGQPALVEAYQCDFAVLAQVRELGARLRSSYERIDLLANNAGGIFPGHATTVDGHGLTIQVNHLAPFLLSHELRQRLSGGRIVNTASAAHALGTLDPAQLSGRQRRPMMEEYGTAKQANILFAAEAARRWPEITSASFHPGVVRTGFGRDSSMVSIFYKITPFLRSPEQGARTLVWLATAPKEGIRSGGYYVDERLRKPATKARGQQAAEQLWLASLRATSQPD